MKCSQAHGAGNAYDAPRYEAR